MPKYRSVVFLDSPEDFDRWYVEYDENNDDGFRYLMQWEYGDDGEIRDTEPWGLSDQISIHMDGPNKYVVSYNWHLSYVSLTEILEDSE